MAYMRTDSSHRSEGERQKGQGLAALHGMAAAAFAVVLHPDRAAWLMSGANTKPNTCAKQSANTLTKPLTKPLTNTCADSSAHTLTKLLTDS